MLASLVSTGEVLAALLPILLIVNSLKKAEEGANVWAPATMLETWKKSLALALGLVKPWLL